MAGTLFLVSTPIGNLEDISARAVQTLRDVDLIACEDTRTTRKLLDRLQVSTRTTSYHEHNEREKTEQLTRRLVNDAIDIALVSDAGTPSISDPGLRLVRAARSADCPIRAIPGPSAITTALVLSGLPCHRFSFIGFLPSKGSQRQRAIDALSAREETTIVFETARRLPALLAALNETLGPREAFVARELTKRFEEHRAGTLRELAQWAAAAPLKGEITLVVAGPDGAPVGPPSDAELGEAFRALVDDGLSRRDAVKRLAKQHGLKTRELYEMLLHE